MSSRNASWFYIALFHGPDFARVSAFLTDSPLSDDVIDWAPDLLRSPDFVFPQVAIALFKQDGISLMSVPVFWRCQNHV